MNDVLKEIKDKLLSLAESEYDEYISKACIDSFYRSKAYRNAISLINETESKYEMEGIVWRLQHIG